MLTTKTESGVEIKLWIEDNKIKGSLENIVSGVEVEEMEEQGFDCLYFGTAKVKGKKQNIFTKINKDIRNWLDKIEKEERERSCKVEIKLHKGSGWNSDDKYLEIEKKRMSDDQKEMLNTIKRNTKQSAVFAGGPEEIIVNDLSVEPGEKYTLAELYEIVTNTDEHQEKIEKQKQREKEIKDKFAKAKGTGEKVLLSSRSVPCDGSAVECSLDIIRVYAIPDGSEKSERIHTH